MGCNAINDEQLIGLTTGELGFWRGWRLRRHLARCADCRAALTGMQTLWRAARIGRDKTVDEDVKERLYASMTSTLRLEPNTSPIPSFLAMPRRSKKAALAAVLLTALVLVTPGVATIVVVHYSQKEAERRQIGNEWEQLGWMTRQEYVKLRRIKDSALPTGRMSDQDLEWSLSLLRRSSDSGARARILGILGVLKNPPERQRIKLSFAIAPFLNSSDELDKRYSLRVRRMLNRNGFAKP